MSNNLYIPIEVKNRELHGKILLATIAAENGFNVILGKKNNLNDLITKMPSGIYFGIGAFENFKKFYIMLNQLNFKIFICEEEGLVTYTEKMYLDMRLSKETLYYIEEFFSWGENNQEIMKKNFPNFREKFFPTGNPRFDLLKKENHDVFKKEMTMISSKYKNFILICTSFSSVNHFDQKLNYLGSLIEKKTLRSEESIKNFSRYSKVKKKTFNSYKELISKLAESNKKINIVIRPHPSENIKVYNDLARDYNNVFVDTNFSVHPWIIKAKALIHHYCTTSIEALAVGTPRFSFRPIKDTLSETDVPFNCSNVYTELNTLIKHLNLCMINNENYIKQDKYYYKKYEKLVNNLSEDLSSTLIVNRFLSNKGVRKIFNDNLYINKKFKLAYAVSFYIIKKFFRKMILPNKSKNKYTDHKFKNFTYKEILEIFHFFNKGSSNIICTKFGTDFINVYKKQ